MRRLRRGADVRRVLRRGRRCHAGDLVLHALPIDPPDTGGDHMGSGVPGSGPGSGVPGGGVPGGGVPKNDITSGPAVRPGPRSGSRPGSGADAAAARVTVVAGRRVGSAVRRNRAKRVLREAARTVDPRGGLDLVLVARPSTPDRSPAELVPQLRGCLERVG